MQSTSAEIRTLERLHASYSPQAYNRYHNYLVTLSQVGQIRFIDSYSKKEEATAGSSTGSFPNQRNQLRLGCTYSKVLSLCYHNQLEAVPVEPVSRLGCTKGHNYSCSLSQFHPKPMQSNPIGAHTLERLQVTVHLFPGPGGSAGSQRTRNQRAREPGLAEAEMEEGWGGERLSQAERQRRIDLLERTCSDLSR